MKTEKLMKALIVLGISGIFAGCASAPTEEAAPAEEAAPQVETKAVQADDTYIVIRGDSLWKISGKPEIYGNPYHWPLIYKANRDKIKDADLIYPGQEFTIARSSNQAEIDAAVEHARTRGAWSLGKVEASDEAYLAR